MDLALRYSTVTNSLDIAVDGADLLAEDTLATAVMLSLMCDRLAQAHEVPTGEDRRGWWADAWPVVDGDAMGSRLWLLMREKQLPSTVERARLYAQEALQWLVDDGFVKTMNVLAFAPRMGWLVLEVRATLNDGARRWRFEWSDQAQVWRLTNESFQEAASAV